MYSWLFLEKRQRTTKERGHRDHRKSYHFLGIIFAWGDRWNLAASLLCWLSQVPREVFITGPPNPRHHPTIKHPKILVINVAIGKVLDQYLAIKTEIRYRKILPSDPPTATKRIFFNIMIKIFSKIINKEQTKNLTFTFK